MTGKEDTADFRGGLKKEAFTSRQRVIRCLNRLPTDRMPIDLGGHCSTGISAFAYWQLREYLGLSTDNICVPDVFQFLAKVDEDVLRRFNCDCILLHPGWPATRRWKPRGKYEFIVPATMKTEQNDKGDWIVNQPQPDGGQWSMRMPNGGFFFDGDGISNFHECGEDELIERTAREAERIYKETDYATMYMGGFSAYFGGGFDIDFLMRMITNPKDIIEANRQKIALDLEKVGKVIDAMGEYIQVIEIADDMGTQAGPMVNPSAIEQCCAPFIKKFCDFVHNDCEAKVFLHCCGSIKPLIPIFIDCGVDVLNPVQISANNMDPLELKDEFGDRIVFWGGGCNTQNVLGFKSPQDVAENVRQLTGVFKSGGGFVFGPIHNIMGDVKPENIVAMYDTAYEESFY